jgi:cytochrome P450
VLFTLSGLHLFTICATLLLAFLVYKVLETVMSPINKIPGPKTSGITGLVLGQLPVIFKEPPIVPQLAWVKEYGPMVSYRTALFSLKVVVTSPSALKRMLVTNVKNYPKNDFTVRMLSPIVGKSILLSENEEHRRQKAYLSPAFHFTHHARFQLSFANTARKLSQCWEATLFHEDKKPREVDVNEAMTKMTLDIIGLTAFGYNFDSLSANDSEIVKHYHTVFESATLSIMRILKQVFPVLEKVPTEENNKLAFALNAIKKQVKDIIEMKRKLPDDQQGDDLLSIMLQTSIDENGQKVSAKGVSATELVDNVMTFMVAGHETTATTLTWALHLLSLNPDTQIRLHREVDEVLKGELPTPESMDKLPLIGAAIDETLRLFPAAPLTSRKTLEDDVLDGYKIPAGTVMIRYPITPMNRFSYYFFF